MARRAGWIAVLAVVAAAGAGELRARPSSDVASLDVTVLGDPDDPRAAAIAEAVEFWNRELSRLGAGIALGPVRFADARSAEPILRRLETGEIDVRSARRLLPALASIPGGVVVVLSGAEVMSFGVPSTPRSRGLVVLRRGDVEPLSLPNVARNAAAHELGHVLGLEHGDDPAYLMCGRPAPCRPDAYASPTPRFFPLTREDERVLVERWPR